MPNKQHQHGGRREGSGRPPLPCDQKMRRRPIGMLESDWRKVAKLAKREKVSVDEIMRRLVRAASAATGGRVTVIIDDIPF